MSAVTITAAGGDRYLVAGPLLFQTVAEARMLGLRLLSERERLVLDLSGVVQSDSAALALLIEWMREARRRGTGVHFENVPSQLQAIARASQVDQFLP